MHSVTYSVTFAGTWKSVGGRLRRIAVGKSKSPKVELLNFHHAKLFMCWDVSVRRSECRQGGLCIYQCQGCLGNREWWQVGRYLLPYAMARVCHCLHLVLLGESLLWHNDFPLALSLSLFFIHKHTRNFLKSRRHELSKSRCWESCLMSGQLGCCSQHKMKLGVS